jgi:hypothetical protein
MQACLTQLRLEGDSEGLDRDDEFLLLLWGHLASLH